MRTVFVWVNSRWVRFSILDLLGARVELKEVISHRQLMTKLSDLAKVQGANITWAQQTVQAPHWWHDTDCVCQVRLCMMRLVYTSSFAISSCSSSISLRAVSSWFCFRRDWPIRAANSRSRSFCSDTWIHTYVFSGLFLVCLFFYSFSKKNTIAVMLFFSFFFYQICSDGTDRNKHAETCDKQRWSVRQLNLILYNPVHLLGVSLLPPPAGGWLPWCHDTSWWPGPPCLSTALWERERGI